MRSMAAVAVGAWQSSFAAQKPSLTTEGAPRRSRSNSLSDATRQMAASTGRNLSSRGSRNFFSF